MDMVERGCVSEEAGLLDVVTEEGFIEDVGFVCALMLGGGVEGGLMADGREEEEGVATDDRRYS